MPKCIDLPLAASDAASGAVFSVMSVLCRGLGPEYFFV